MYVYIHVCIYMYVCIYIYIYSHGQNYGAPIKIKIIV